MDYHVNSHGNYLGMFSVDELRRRRAAGELSGDALVRSEGMTEWKPLDEVLEDTVRQPQCSPGQEETDRSPKPGNKRVLVLVIAVFGGLMLLALGFSGFMMFRFVQKTRESLKTATSIADKRGLAAASKHIPVSETTLTRETVRERAREFRLRQYLEGYRKHGRHDVPWDEDAARLIEAWIAVNYGGPTNLPSPTEIAEKLIAIPECNDALILTAAAAVTPDLHERIRRFDRALAAYTGSAYGAYPQFFVAVQLANDLGSKSPRTPELDVTALEQFKRGFEDGSFTPADEEEIAYILIEDWGSRFFARNNSAVIQIVLGHPEYKWLALTLQGEMEIEEAWKARGSGWANTVTPEGWKGFEDHLARARAALTQAWKLHPQRPLAPCCMITVAMGDSDANEMRVWFDRAIEGQIDLYSAWNRMQTGLLPRWHGSHAALLALGVRAVDTSRFDTDVPRQLFECIKMIEGDLELAPGEHIYGRPDVWPHLKRMYEGYLAEPSQAQANHGWHSAYAVVAYLAGKYDVARSQLEAIDWKPTRRSLTQWGKDLSLLPLQVAAITGEHGQEILRAESDYARGDLSKAIKIYQDLRGKPHSDDRTKQFIEARLPALEQELRLAKGEWIDLVPADQQDPNWELFGHTIRKLPDGAIEIEAGPGGHAIYCRTRIGRSFEVTGEFEVVRSSTGAFQAGLMMGIPDDPSPAWYAFRITRNPPGNDAASFSLGWTRRELTMPAKLKDGPNTFRFSIVQRRVNAWINDVRTLRVAEEQEQFVLKDNCMLGLGAYNNTNETVIRYRNVKVRRITSTE